MNLHANYKDSGSFELWQTPSWVTDMALTNHENKQRHWKDTRHLYSKWIKSHTQGAWSSREEYEDMRDRVDWHIEDLYSAGELEFYMM